MTPRNFADLSLRRLLARPFNAHGLLSIVAARIAETTTPDRMERQSTTYIDERFRERESDVLWLVRTPEGDLAFYILLEHQSDHDPDLPLRLVIYLGRVADQWLREQGDPGGAGRWPPILPVVLHTGADACPRVLDPRRSSAVPREFLPYVPSFRIHLLSVKRCPRRRLLASGHPFGRILDVVRAESLRRPALERALAEAARELERLAGDRPADLADYVRHLVALVYHRRRESERPVLLDAIDRNLSRSDVREEFRMAHKTAAEELIEQGIEQGIEKGVRRTLLRQIHKKFGPASEAVRHRVSAADAVQVETWIDRILDASTLDDLFSPRPRAE